MSSQVSICNMALRQLGAARISAIDEDVEPARILNDVYDDIRNEVLRTHPWNFASIRVALVVTADTPAFDYTYSFQLPADCLRVIRMSDTDIEFKIEEDRLLTNESTAKILYVKKTTDVSLYDAGFITALATRLAAEIAYPITNSEVLAQNKYKEYLEKLKLAKTMDAQEGSVEPIDDSSWDDDRA